LCDCTCGDGIFAAWNDGWVIYAALILNVVYGWLKGILTKDFGSVATAIADCFVPLIIYFIGDPFVNYLAGKPMISGGVVTYIAVSLVAVIVPLSTAIYIYAEQMLEGIKDALQKEGKGQALEAGDTDSGSGSDLSTSASVAKWEAWTRRRK